MKQLSSVYSVKCHLGHLGHLKSYKQIIVLSLIVIITLLFTSCGSQPLMTFTVQHRQVLSGIPSASGIAKVKDALYVIGDNSAWLYQLDDQYKVIHQYLLLPGITDSILPKATKPDFEAMTTIQTEGETALLIFGSGSKSPERDVIVSVRFTDTIHTTLYPAPNFYSALHTSNLLDSKTINIEAVAAIGDALYLFNREHNLLLEYSLKDVLGFLKKMNDLPIYNTYRINLPELNGLSAKFSGASAITDSKQIVFTASVENAPNTYDDGEVLGSYIGIINIVDLEDGYTPPCILIADNLKPIAIKVESAEVLKMNNHREATVVLVTDSDGGASELLVGQLNW